MNRNDAAKTTTQIRNRLRLAKTLLEESDRLGGAEAYGEFNEDAQLPHERHEREAVVLYLLLTCLDLLGQSIKHTSFQSWINSKKIKHIDERKIAIEQCPKNSGHLAVVSALLSQYNEIYGVTSSFYRGLTKLPPNAEEYLLSSIKVRRSNNDPDSSILDESQEQVQKIKYLFKMRNAFTHSLDQHFVSSAPMMSAFANETSASSTKETAAWGVMVQGSHVVSWGTNTISIGSFIYEVSDLILKLFEVLNAAIGDPFDRSDIDINMFIFHLKSSGFQFERSIKNKDVDGYLAKLGAKRPKWEIATRKPN